MDLAALVALARSVGFPDPELAAAVAMAESGGNPCARGDPRIAPDCSDPGVATSIGLWQIHFTVHRQYDAMALFDPTYNAQAAYAISSAGTNWHPWSTYTTTDPAVSYRRFYQPAAQGAASSKAPLVVGTVLAVGAGLWWLSKRPRRLRPVFSLRPA